MNWRAAGLTLTIVGIATALACWAWSTLIHEQRHDCRLKNVFGGGSSTCPSKIPAIVGASVGGVLAVIGIALIIGAAGGRRHDR